MFNVMFAIICIAIAFLTLNLFYLMFRQTSKIHVRLIVLHVSMLLMLIGYAVEVCAGTEEAAMLGAAFSYLGKPFAMLSSTLFIAEVCGRRIPNVFTVIMSAASLIFPILVFSNSYHHLFYSSVAFDRSRTFSPLILGHALFYYIYAATVVFYMVMSIVIVVKELMYCKDRTTLLTVTYLAGVIATSAVGYILYAAGLAGGFDSTILGTLAGTLIFSVLFFKFKFLDYMTLAKERALNDASSGLLVLNSKGRTVYQNALVEKLTASGLTLEELSLLNGENSILYRDERVFEIRHIRVKNRNILLGEIFEFTDITEKHNYSETLEKEVEKRTSELVNLQHCAIISFAGIVEARDNSTGEHIHRMSSYAGLIAKQLRKSGKYTDILSDSYIDELVEVAPLHDIGKLCIPDSILLKPGRLTPEEFDLIKTHTTSGAKIIDECFGNVGRKEYVLLANEIALYHHEKWSGGGYPAGLEGDSIPLSARICAVADVYDAIRSERCYKPPMDAEEAKQVIIEGSGNHFDPAVVEAFLAVLPEVESA